VGAKFAAWWGASPPFRRPWLVSNTGVTPAILIVQFYPSETYFIFEEKYAYFNVLFSVRTYTQQIWL